MELLTMILVDDEPIILKGLLETYNWAGMGFSVVGTAKNGADALRLIEEKQPDVALTDVRMKKMDGLTLIERVKEAGWKTSFVVLSAYRDFEYAQKACRHGALSYLVKPIEEDELERTMAEVYELCTEKKFKEKNYTIWERILLEDKDNFLNQMLERYLEDGISEEELADFFRSLHRQEELEHYFAVVAVGIDLACRVANQKEYEMKQYLLETRLQKKLKENYRIWTQKGSGQTACYVVDLGSSPELEGVKETLLGQRQELKNELVSALSAPRRGIAGMKDAYHTALRLYEAASEAGATFLSAREHQDIGRGAQYSLDVEAQILTAIRKNDKLQVKKVYEKFIYTLPEKEEIAKVYLHRLAVRIEFALEDSSMLTEEMRMGFRNFYQILKQVSLLKLVDVLYQLFLSIVRLRIETDMLPSEEYFKDYISSAVFYIQEHLHEETLSITEVSEYVYLNSVYFGRIFKKVMNVSFKRYVQNMRMEMAKELLLEENESIAGICLKVGIPNQSYFTQLFKQNTGVLPSEYKRSLQ